MDPHQILRDRPAKHPFFVGIDSDGCAFDAMDIKHKQCFGPAFIEHFALQPVEAAARDVWAFVNLYSATRGTNRFAAIPLALDLLKTHPDVVERGFAVPAAADLRDWLARESRLGAPALEAELQRRPSPELAAALAWHRDVNARIAALARDIPPFPHVRDCLERMRGRADLMIVSQASQDAIQREWAGHDLLRFMDAAAGQEFGSKREQLRHACGGKYDPGRVLMIGDAPGDRDAALGNGVRFYPIIPGDEAASWQRLRDDALPRFFADRFDPGYQDALLAEFARALPAHPPWRRGG